ncbi:MAG: shikimate dehydrogenase [Pseudonocardiaceae bacterium]|nr:shikimate dehydrogenase [Pseudonocardiaceae bacterium]
MSTEEVRRAGVLGRPVAHSLSPVLHRAAYAQLGLAGWRYDPVECGDDELPDLVAGLGPDWVGLSVTMPGKVAALRMADVASERAVIVGAANTLVRGDHGWSADCTDVDGVVGALRAVGGPRTPATGRAVLLGAGGTARAALAGLIGWGVVEVDLVVRDAGRAAETVHCAERLGLAARVLGWGEVTPSRCAGADVVVSTVPADASEQVAPAVARAPVVLDAAYHPWPTPVAVAVATAGGRLASGLDMLLHQAFGQVEQFTGLSAPREAMRDALQAATGRSLLPLTS